MGACARVSLGSKRVGLRHVVSRHPQAGPACSYTGFACSLPKRVLHHFISVAADGAGERPSVDVIRKAGAHRI